VKIQGLNGDSISLEPTGYQFPVLSPRLRDPDSNWLMIRGTVVVDTRIWSFHEPSLLVNEANQLGSWLIEVARGAVPVTENDLETPEGEVWPSLYFVEPNLAFSVASRVGTLVSVRVHLSLESAPRDDPHVESFDIYKYFVDLQVTSSELESAAREWLDSLALFPSRRSTAEDPD